MDTASEWLAHTAEVKLRVRAPSFAALAAEAGRAVARLELRRAPPPARGASRLVEVHAADRDALLVDWLNELVYLAETESWVATEFAVEVATETLLRARVRGIVVPEAPARIKAATFHDLDVRAVAGGVEADVVFDV